ncbi:hypothetical protein Mp_4g04490 [Marchantia polymorpha subsp. ruderalis]|uniref:Uncharacterized protein n=2 Tax=Marchantia polymorpha TaxID=3197 RepID=A0AAF6B6C1_MARPO|nr:hypothetical protein MARPO_0044s0024 [Marchantia polymorpha]BBN07555.1 hypothetical protein Mp_4g04490 [Marchantia polymorpha subsp. ruderalis]|eukprot:PTQ39545.1 hypothetical protein MARPO_0044s0024 [Marchantia polymorpha]
MGKSSHSLDSSIPVPCHCSAVLFSPLFPPLSAVSAFSSSSFQKIWSKLAFLLHVRDKKDPNEKCSWFYGLSPNACPGDDRKIKSWILGDPYPRNKVLIIKNAIKQAIRDTRELGTRLLDLGYRLIHALRASCFMDIIIGLYPCKSYSVFRPGTILDLIIKQMERDSFFDKSAVRAAAYSAMLGGFVTR